MRISNLVLSCSIVAAIAVNLSAYEAGPGADDNGEATNTATGFNASATGGSEATAIGASSNASASGAVSLGNSNATGVESFAGGSNATAAGQYSTSVGAYSSALADRSTAIGFGAVANESNVVSFGRGVENGDPTDVFVRLINVADPINAHDAVNLNYLTTNYYTKAVTDAALATTLSSANSYTDTVAATTLSQANAYTDAAVGNIVNTANQYTDQQIAKVSKEAAQGTALAIALSTPLDFSNGSNAMAIGTGFYKGQSALSVVGGKRLDSLTYTAGIAKTGGEHAVKLSLGFSW